MNAEHLVEAQRELRTRLLDREHVAWHPARELAARLLLHLDDTQFCWQFATEWLRDALDADRVDGGFGAPALPVYRPHAEARRITREVPSMLGASIDAFDRGVRCVWSAEGAVVFRDVEQDPRLGTGLRDSLLASGMRNTIASALVHQGTPLGLVCADWMERRVDDADGRCERFQQVARVVLSPILATSRRLGMEPSLLTRLSPAERRVAELVAAGLSYKEIARRLDRSVSTIDHQLRSVRRKLGARSNSRLVRMLADQLAAAPQAASGS
ncbi:MAG TPA: helix-turn-helix transcriptional regulator [Burkholderiaceae bacterium]|nr:helix-turn-helix transcriptional regulator [Burkholderiaceae bacterium]